jgi:hypothetical protein
MSLVGAGRYDLSMDVVGNGVSVFAHRDVGIGAGIAAGFDYAHWSAGDTMPVTETKHGIVVGRLLLSDEPDPSDTGGEFAPTESTPAPAEPQPHPEPPGASTTLVCSPATVPVGDTTTCHVDVSDLDSYASATPTGQVDFSSDESGSFSEDRCTLSTSPRGMTVITPTSRATTSPTCRFTYALRTPRSSVSRPRRGGAANNVHGNRHRHRLGDAEYADRDGHLRQRQLGRIQWGSVQPFGAQQYEREPRHFASLTELDQRIMGFQTEWQHVAKPIDWRYTRRDLNDYLDRLTEQDRLPRAA